MTKKLYLLVTKDKYELPLAVVDNPQELARITGKSKNSVLSAITHYYNNGIGCPFRRVDVEWEEDEI